MKYEKEDLRSCTHYDSNLGSGDCSLLRAKGFSGENARKKIKEKVDIYISGDRCPFGALQNWSVCPLSPKYKGES